MKIRSIIKKKKIIQTIKLRKLKSAITQESLKNFENKEFYVLYKDGTWEYIMDTYDLRKALEKDHIKPIYYIFDNTDRIIVDRKVLIDTNIKEEE